MFLARCERGSRGPWRRSATGIAFFELADLGAGTTPRVHASGGKTRFGRSRPDVNRYLKWAFIEAANAICLTRRRRPSQHVSRLYDRIARRRGHPRATGAIARHLAEATFWILSKQEPYREPKVSTVAERRLGTLGEKARRDGPDGGAVSIFRSKTAHDCLMLG